MNLRPAIHTVRHVVRYANVGQQFLPASSPISHPYFLKNSSTEVRHRCLCFHSTACNHGTRLKMQPAWRIAVFQSWNNALWTNASPAYGTRTITGCVGAVRGMAGHSKWANIRHIKAAKDNEKARVINEYTRKIRAFVRETGQTDPKTSSQLAKLITEAKSKNVPNANVDRVLAQMSNLKNSSPIMFTAKGPSGSMILIEALTTNITQTKSQLQSVVKKCGFSIFDSGTLARIAFEEKGIVEVTCPEDSTPDLEAYVDIAIEAGAEEVTLEDDEEGNKVLQFVCEPSEVYLVKKELEARQLPISSAEVVYNSTSMVTLDSTMLDLISKAMEKLDEHPDVLRVYINVEESS